MTRPLLFCPVLLLAALGSATGDALTVSVDEFSITRDGLAFFDDPFGDGTPPPAAPDFASGGAASYGVTGTIPSDAESGGELHLDSTDGALIDNADGAPRDAIVITLLTSTTGGDTQIGSGDTFDEKGDFSLTTPPGPLYSVYGVRLTDSAGSGAAHQVLQLGVEFDPMTGRNDVAYLLQDFDAHSVTVLASADFDPPAEANELRLELARPDATNDQVLASVSYLSGGVAVPGSFSFIMPGLAFQQEDFVRGQILVSQAVPEPAGEATIALLALASVSCRRRAKTARYSRSGAASGARACSEPSAPITVA